MEIKKIKIEFEKGFRIIVISDIHGDLDSFKKLLKKINYQEKNDYLILLGDYFNRGKQNLETLHYIMELSKNEKCISLKGNHEQLFLRYDLEERDEDFLHFRWDAYTLAREMCKKSKINLDSDISLRQVMDIIKKDFEEEYNFIKNLPVVLESDDYVFVHAGIKNVLSNDVMDYVYIERYNDICSKHNKMTIVGHYPSINYKDKTDYNPYYNYAKNLISIDGGCNVKSYGQLNALIIEKGEYHHTYQDKYTKYKVINDQEIINKDTIKIMWPYNKIKIIENLGDFSLCYSYHLNKEVKIFNKCIYEKDNEFFAREYSNYKHNVCVGDTVSLIFKGDKYSFVKLSGINGWIHNRCIFKED